MRFGGIVFALLALVAASCKTEAASSSGDSDGGSNAVGASDAGSGPHACDPLSAQPETFSGIVGVAQAHAGEVFAVDIVNVGPHVYELSNGTFIRRISATSYEGGSATTTNYTIGFEGLPNDVGIGPLMLVQVSGGAVTSMAFGTDGVKGEGMATEVLTLLERSMFAQTPIVGLPLKMLFVGDAQDGRTAMILSTTERGSPGFFYLGAGGKMVQENTTCFAGGGGSGPQSVTCDFTDAGEHHVFTWTPTTFDQNGTPSGGAWGVLTANGSGPGVNFKARDPLPTTLQDFSFTCL
jgi:hypothetical protein